MTEKQTEALEKLNQGIQESRKEVQQRTMNLAQDYFGDSTEVLKQQIKENRAALKGLPDQIPGGREEAFQALFQELMDNYSAMEECINEARQNVANLDTDQIRRQGEVEATDAARREARELGIDLTEVEGTGSDGRVTVDDVKKLGETMEDGEEEPEASEAARRRAEEMGLDLSQIEGTGTGGQVTVKDVTSLGGEAKDQARQVAGQAAQQAQDTAGQAQQAVGQVGDQAGQAAQGAQDTLGQAAGQVTDLGGGSVEEINASIDASDAAKREANERGIDLSKVEGTGADGRIVYWDVMNSAAEADSAGQPEDGAGDVAGQAAQGASDAASQATDQAGRAANQAGEAATQVASQADGAVEQTGGAANQLAEQAIGTARQTADQAGQTAQQGAGSVAGSAVQGNGQQESAEEPNATRAARRKAEEMGVELSKVQGTGAGGLITIKDVMGA